MYKFNSVIATFALLLLLAPVASHAESGNNYYVQLEMGPQWREKASDSLGSASFETGFSLGGAVGCRLPASFRAEFEGSYFYNAADTLQAKGATELNGDGFVEAEALFGNIYYDIPLGQSRFTPYVGVGVGSYKVAVRGLTNDELREWKVPAVTEDSSWTSAWQARIGTNIALNKQVDMLVGYRYLHGSTMDIVGTDGTVIHPNLRLHNLELGLRYNF